MIGADAVLLIAGILSPSQMKEYADIAHSLGLETLTEVHNEQELEKVGELMTDFNVDLETTARLAGLTDKSRVLVSESGIRANADMKRVRSFGADAVLVGETLMRSRDIGRTLRTLREGV